MSTDGNVGIWMAVKNVRWQMKVQESDGDKDDQRDWAVYVQLEGDREDHEPKWWEINLVSASGDAKSQRELYKAINDALGKNEVALARLGQKENGKPLVIFEIRVQHHTSS